MVLDLSTFIVSLSQVSILFSSVLIKVSLSLDGKSSKLKYIVVSSANIKYENLVLVCTMSLMYMLKNNSPNMDLVVFLIECFYISVKTQVTAFHTRNKENI